jgi:hypothetical protein
MGKFDGKHIRGLVGNLVQRKTKYGLVVQMAAARVKQSKATKKAQKVFGQGSTLACAIRKDLLDIIHQKNDSGMVNRFNAPIKDVLKQCVNEGTGHYVFQENSFERLAGFEFNVKSLLINSLLVKPEVSLNGNILKVSLPEVEVLKELKFPGNTNVCELVVSVAMIALHAGKSKEMDAQSIEIQDSQGILPAQDFEFEVSEGCLCVAGIGLRYFKVNDHVRVVFNSITFNPANICGAIITPGTFIVPPPFVKIGNKTITTNWRTAGKINLPAAE